MVTDCDGYVYVYGFVIGWRQIVTDLQKMMETECTQGLDPNPQALTQPNPRALTQP